MSSSDDMNLLYATSWNQASNVPFNENRPGSENVFSDFVVTESHVPPKTSVQNNFVASNSESVANSINGSNTLPLHVQELLTQATNFSSAPPVSYNNQHETSNNNSFLSPNMTTSPQYLASMGLPQDLLTMNASQGNSIPDFSKIATTPPPPNPAASIVGPNYPNIGMMTNISPQVTPYPDLPPAIFNHPPPTHVVPETNGISSLARNNGAGLPPQLAAAFMQQQLMKTSQHPPMVSNAGIQDLNMQSSLAKRQHPIHSSDLSHNLLQRMQMQRRAERKEYQERRLIDENWPGFGVMNQGMEADTLWDPGMDPDSQWRNLQSDEFDTNSIWSSGGAGAIWSPVATSSTSRWFEGPDGFMAGGGGGEQAPANGPVHGGPPMAPPDNTSSLGLFNPFDSLRNIWGQRPEPSALAPGEPVPAVNPANMDPSRRLQNEAMILEHEKQVALHQMQQANDDARQQSLSKQVWGFPNTQ